MKLHVNNKTVQSQPACAAATALDAPDATRPCGDILYGQEAFLSDYCRTGKTALTLGTYDDVTAKRTFSHVGAIKSVRILQVALSGLQVSSLYGAHTTLPSTHPKQYWVKSSGRVSDAALHLAEIRSPDSNAALANESISIRLLGGFQCDKIYRVIFSYQAPSGLLHAEVSEKCHTECGGECSASVHNHLVCRTPVWPHGFGASVLSLSSAPNTTVGVWSSVWQKVGDCCGCTCIRICVYIYRVYVS